MNGCKDASKAVESASEKMPLELRILELFDNSSVMLIGPTDVEKLLPGVSKGTASPKLRNLADAGYLARNGEKYEMGPKFFRMYLLYSHRVSAHLTELREITNSRVDLLLSVFGQMRGEERGTA